MLYTLRQTFLMLHGTSLRIVDTESLPAFVQYALKKLESLRAFF
jgi:hypothetical protein